MANRFYTYGNHATFPTAAIPVCVFLCVAACTATYFLRPSVWVVPSCWILKDGRRSAAL